MNEIGKKRRGKGEGKGKGEKEEEKADFTLHRKCRSKTQLTTSNFVKPVICIIFCILSLVLRKLI